MSEVAINAPNLWRLETPGHTGWERTAHADDPKKYFIVSSDSHVNEPPNLWEKRIDPQRQFDEYRDVRAASACRGSLLTRRAYSRNRLGWSMV
jgi:hypothetical protein